MSSNNIIFRWPVSDHNMFRCIVLEIGNKNYKLNDFQIEEVLLDGEYLVFELIPPEGCSETDDLITHFDRNVEKFPSTLKESYYQWKNDREESYRR